MTGVADIAAEVERAESRIRAHVRETLLDPAPHLSEAGGAEVYCKLENLQYTGSFKARGAMNKVLSLREEERARGIVTASSGNHGAAVAFSLKENGLQGLVFVPENASPAKVENIGRYGAEVRFHGTDSGETETYARRYAAEHDATYVSPYNDPQVIGGQGTIGIELERQLDGIDAVFASVGGGGLISGVACCLERISPSTRIYGCSPENSQVMIQSVRANRVLSLSSAPTISDGTAGGIEPDAITLALVRDSVDEYVTVSEEEIVAAMRDFMGVQHMMIEGAAGVAIAAYLKMRSALAGKRVVIIVCGANISLDDLKSVL